MMPRDPCQIRTRGLATVSVAIAGALAPACDGSGLDGPSGDAPVPAFSVECQGLSCSFLNVTAGAGATNFSYRWNFGDNTALVTTRNATHRYALPGEFTVTLTVRRFTQPAFGAPSSYADITYDVAWRHRFNDQFTALTGFRAYGGDWDAPVRREDWIYTPSASLSYTHDEHLSAEFAYSYDWAESEVPNTSGREFTRHIVSLGVRYNF